MSDFEYVFAFGLAVRLALSLALIPFSGRNANRMGLVAIPVGVLVGVFR